MTKYLNRVYHTTTSAGQTTSITLSAEAMSDAFLTMDEGGAEDGGLYSYILEEGSDFEVQRNQTYDAIAGTLTRGTPVISKIAGAVGTTKMSLLGNAAVRVTPTAEDFQDIQDQIDDLAQELDDQIALANANAIAMAIALG